MFSLIAAAISLAAQPAAAGQPSETPDSPEITVEGMRDVDRQIGSFVNALTQAPRTGQLSRFDWAVCPAAVGLSDAQNAAVVARMRRVAKAVGIKTAPAGCTTNALVIVTSDKRQLITDMRKKYPAYFEGVSRGDFNRMTRRPGPAAAWQIEGRVDHDGVQLTRDKLTGQYVNERTDTPSRLSPSSRPHFIASVVVVEAKALAGLTVTQLADYAAMRAYARTDPDRLKNSPAPTILTILDAPMDSSVPITMTEWDLGFLKALYSSNQNRYAAHQRHEIRNRLRDDLRGDEREGE